MNFLPAVRISKVKKGLFVVLFAVLPFITQAQKVFSAYPFQFDQIFNNRNMINPAAPLSGKASVQVGYNGFNQLSTNLATYYANARIRFGSDSAHRSHIVGLVFVNDEEGSYLNRSRFAAQYAYSISLTPALQWTSGISMGFVDNILKPNPVVGTESAITLDGDAGTWIRYKRFYGGISVNQIFNNRAIFLNGNYTRKRHGSIMFGTEKMLLPELKIQADVFARTGSETFNKYAAAVQFIYLDRYVAGAVAKSRNGIIPMIGIQNIPIMKNNFCFMFSYRIPTSKFILAGTQNAEIMLQYKF